jgi:SAM-dependent methyltransferase
MTNGLSPRLLAIVDALPLQQGMRVLEIGCGPGAASREITRRIGDGHVLAIDRSAKAIAQAGDRPLGQGHRAGQGRLARRDCSGPAEPASGRHRGFPAGGGRAALRHCRCGARRRAGRASSRGRKDRPATAQGGVDGGLFIDGGNPLREIVLHG